MSLRGSDNWTGDKGGRRRVYTGNSRPNARVLSIERGKVVHTEALESLLSSALRSDDNELDQILSALEEISNSFKSGAANSRSLDNVLKRAASCAIRQSLLDREIRSLAVTDELTSLYNRRGFLASAMHQLKLAHRHSQDAMLLFFDIDNLKGINDAFGHREGDLAIIRAADALEETFRDSDILARLGGDEFAVLASEASMSSREAIVARLDRSLEKANAEESRYKLSLSIGIARFDPDSAGSLGELMARADQDMYANKKDRTRSASSRHSELDTHRYFERHPGFQGEPNERVCYVQPEIGYRSFIKHDDAVTRPVIQTWEWAARCVSARRIEMTTSALNPDPSYLMLQRQAGSSSQGDHVAYFYKESDSLLEALSSFIGGALGAGNAALVIATKMHREGLLTRLTARGLDIPKAINEGRYVDLDAAEVLSKLMVEGMPDSGRFEAIVGGTIDRTRARAKTARPEIAAFGEMVSLLWTEGKVEAAIRLEQLWNELATKLAFSLRCAYPVSHFNGEKNSQPLMRVCAEHSAVVLDEGDASFTSGEAKIALRRSEERFRLLVDAVQDYAIFMLDVQGHVSSWNRGAERIKGYRISEIIGKHFSIFYPEEDIRAGKPRRELEIAAKDGRLEDEGWRLRKDGSRFWANVTITAIRNDTGRLIGFGKVTRDFTEKIKANEALRKEIVEKTAAEKKVRDSEESLRQLSLRLLQTQDDERRRIGRDLHDSVGQYLVGLKMKVDSLKSSRERGQRDDDSALTECSQLVEEAIKEVRIISYLLYPPMLEELGLKSAIPWYLEGFTKRSGIKTTFEVSPEFDRIPGDLELALFRVLQESLTNVHRHSGSPTATVRLLTENRRVLLQIIDEGCGSQSKNWENRAQDWMRTLGVGLRGMDERVRQLGGSLGLSSVQGGTTVTATLPIPDAAPDLSKQE